VAFVRKKPEGEIDARDYMMDKNNNLNDPPQHSRWVRQKQRSKEYDSTDHLAAMSKHERSEFGGVPQHRVASSHTHRVIGLDGMNEMLRGGPSNMDVRVGVNVMEVINPLEDFSSGPYGFLSKLEMLYEYALDGVIISNDEPDSFSSNGSRDNVLFNIAVQGKALLNNGFLQHQVLDEMGSSLANVTGVEAHPRATRDHMVQMNPSVTRSAAWNGASAHGYGQTPYANTNFDFVAQLNGQYTAYPLQMFDRNPMVGVNMYVGLRAIGCTGAMLRNLKDRDGAPYTQTPGASYVYFQYMPYSQRICDLIELTNSAQNLATAGNPDPLALLEAGARDSSSRMVKTGIENDPFAPIKRADWEMMVGAWTVGTVIDTSAARHGQFNSGPPDTSFQCMVNVHVNWMERRHESMAPTGGRALMNRYALAPNLFEPGAGPTFASLLRRDLIQLRGHQQNPTMISRIGSMMVIQSASMTRKSGNATAYGLLKKPTPVLGRGLDNSLAMIARLKLEKISLNRPMGGRKAVLMPSGDRVLWILYPESSHEIIPSTVPLEIVSSWASMVTDLEQFITILKKGGQNVKQTAAFRAIAAATGNAVTDQEVNRYMAYLVIRVANQALGQIISLADEIAGSDAFARGNAKFDAEGTLLEVDGTETDSELRSFFINVQCMRNEYALFTFMDKLWRTVIRGLDKAFPPEFFDKLWKGLPVDRMATKFAKAIINANGDKVIKIVAPSGDIKFDAPAGEVFANLPCDWTVDPDDPNTSTDLELRKLIEGIHRTMQDGNFTNTIPPPHVTWENLIHARGVYKDDPGDATKYEKTKDGLRDDVAADFDSYDPATTVVHGSQLMYPRDEFEYRAIGAPLSRVDKYNDEQIYVHTLSLDQRPSFRAAKGVSDASIKYAWVLIHRALRRHPTSPGDELGAILGKKLYNVLRIPMFLTAATPGTDATRTVDSRNEFFTSLNQFTFGAIVREILRIGAALFIVRGETDSSNIQKDTEAPAGRIKPQTLLEIAAGELAIQELVRRISRSVPNDHVKYGEMHKDPLKPTIPTGTDPANRAGLIEEYQKGRLDYEEVIITWEHFYTYFRFHGDGNNNAVGPIDGIPAKHYYYYDKTISNRPAPPTNAAAAVSDASRLQNMILGGDATGELPVFRTDAEDHMGETAKSFALEVHNSMYPDTPLSIEELHTVYGVPTKASLEAHYAVGTTETNGSASTPSVADVVMENAPALAPAPAPTPAPTPAPAPAPTSAPAPAPTSAPAPAPTSAPAPVPTSAPAPAPTSAPAKPTPRSRTKSPAKPAATSSTAPVASAPTRTTVPTANLMDAPIAPTAASPSPAAAPPVAPPATRAAVGGAAAVRAPPSRASAASIAENSNLFGDFFTNLTGGSSTSAVIPRSPSPTPSAGSNDSGASGPQAQRRRSRS
jgi:hypothetical protein